MDPIIPIQGMRSHPWHHAVPARWTLPRLYTNADPQHMHDTVAVLSNTGCSAVFIYDLFIIVLLCFYMKFKMTEKYYS
jgi:hypothetical protein